MATSPALAWSLANGISQAQFDKNIVDAIKQGEAQGLSDAQFESLMNQYQISAADVARATQSTPAIIQSRMEAATPTTATEIAYDKAAMDELAAREVKNQQQIAANEKAYQEYLRLNEIKNQQQITGNQAAYAEQQRLNNLKYAEQQRLNQLASQQQIATNQKAYEAYLANQAKLAAEQATKTTGFQTSAGTLPFANATQGFAQNFQNYQSIAPGAQYNPAVMPGGASPYSLIMGQMQPMGNPYAGVVAGQAMGGYNPGLYDQIAAANVAKTIAANAGTTLADYYSGGGGDGGDDGGGGDSGGDGGGNGSGAASGDCVDPDVHILLADRSTVRAGDLKVGDMLHTLHDETFVYGDFPVEYVNVLQRPKVEAQFDDGQKIIISITHKFLTADNKWEKISDIEIGTSIRGFGDVTKKLVSITDVGTGPVIEMVVTGAHTYISEGLVSHNKFYGGLITNVSGPDPAGPDEGQVNMMRGEYVIKKSAVNKYGRGLLDMINEGKVPAKKLKSLLG